MKGRRGETPPNSNYPVYFKETFGRGGCMRDDAHTPRIDRLRARHCTNQNCPHLYICGDFQPKTGRRVT